MMKTMCPKCSAINNILADARILDSVQCGDCKQMFRLIDTHQWLSAITAEGAMPKRSMVEDLKMPPAYDAYGENGPRKADDCFAHADGSRECRPVERNMYDQPVYHGIRPPLSDAETAARSKLGPRAKVWDTTKARLGEGPVRPPTAEELRAALTGFDVCGEAREGWRCKTSEMIGEGGDPVGHDPVNHPAHYTAGGIECIDAIRAALTPEEFRGFCKGNALKYVWREGLKNGDEDLQKAGWYLGVLPVGEADEGGGGAG